MLVFLPLKKSKGSSKRSIGTMLNIIKYYQKPLLLKCKTVKQTPVDEKGVFSRDYDTRKLK
jgi:hypothetical protein